MNQKPMDWPFTPSSTELEGLNKLRDYHRLTRIEKVTMASEWSRACFEIDECAEASEPNAAGQGREAYPAPACSPIQTGGGK